MPRKAPEPQHDFAFAPSLCHRHVMAETPRELAYDGGDVAEWQARLRPRLSELLGRTPSQRCDLNVRSLWRREHELGTIEKLVFTAEPFADVPAFLCLPKGVEPPYPCFICLQGHSTGMHNSIRVDRDDNTKKIQVEGDRDFAIGCLERGVAALCIEQRSFGERRETVQQRVAAHGCHDATMHALQLGRTLIGERVWDVDRGIDLLAARDDIDMRRLGVMGNSGGGTITTFAAAVLPRIQIAMPSCYFCTFSGAIMSLYHCMDNYVPGLLTVAECADVLGLFAPKPVVVVAGQEDNIFPIDEVHKAFDDLKRIYEAAGAGDRCHLVVGPEGHRFYAELAWQPALQELARL